MHRHGRHERLSVKKKGSKQTVQRYDDALADPDSKISRNGRRTWQQEKQILRQINPRDLNEYLLDLD